MVELGSSTRAAGDEFRFSLRQTIAVMTAMGAAFALYRVLVSPPLGSSGLSWAMLPAVVLAVALWFCCTARNARLATYTVAATLFAVVFFACYLSRTDWLFGHTQGPPQLVLATCLASTIGGLSGVLWLVATFGGEWKTAATDAASGGGGSSSPRWPGAMAILPLMLLSGLLGLTSFSSLPRAMRRMDNYVRQRKLQAEMWAPRRREPPLELTPEHQQEIYTLIARNIAELGSGDPTVRRPAARKARAGIRSIREHSPQAQLFDMPATKTALINGLDDDDPAVRLYVAMAILELGDQAERADRLRAIASLGEAKNTAQAVNVPVRPVPSGSPASPNDEFVADAPDFMEVAAALERVLDGKQDHECRAAAIRSLGRMGTSAPRLGVELERGDASERAAAAEALAAMGSAAKPFAFCFGQAWQKRLISLEHAQLVYKIDPQAGASYQIPNPQSPP